MGVSMVDYSMMAPAELVAEADKLSAHVEHLNARARALRQLAQLREHGAQLEHQQQQLRCFRLFLLRSPLRLRLWRMLRRFLLRIYRILSRLLCEVRWMLFRVAAGSLMVLHPEGLYDGWSDSVLTK
jgi:hypothetical protein